MKISVSRRSSGPGSINLKPAAEAFALGYVSTSGPQVISLLIRFLKGHKSARETREKILQALRDGFNPFRFPAFCGFLVGGSTVLQGPIYKALKAIVSRTVFLSKWLTSNQQLIVARFLASLFSAALSFHLVNIPSNEPESAGLMSVRSPPEQKYVKDGVAFKGRPRSSTIPKTIPMLPLGIETLPIRPAEAGALAGKTLDITLFAFVRALDALCHLSPIPRNPRIRWLRETISKYSSPFLFITSCATIMHAFFYAPLRLPHTYRNWISRIAYVDERLVHALRQARFGNFIYGKETGIGPLLGDMCDDYHLPREWGNPAVTIPIPCELVHHGAGPNCEIHALWRLSRGIVIAMGVYAPLQALVLIRRLRKPGTKASQAVVQAFTDAFRSSAFLGSFVALFYYGVCLARTRLGRPLLGDEIVTPQMWDSGLDVLSGCWLCGWSIFVELPKRRTELALFVLPRSLAVWLPRRYELEHRWKEHTVFALSAAVVLTAAQSRSDNVRGVFGGLLNRILTAK